LADFYAICSCPRQAFGRPWKRFDEQIDHEVRLPSNPDGRAEEGQPDDCDPDDLVGPDQYGYTQESAYDLDGHAKEDAAH